MVYLQDVTIPDNTMMKPGETFTKTWLIYNSGTCTWDESYHLAFAGGDPMGAPMENRIPKTAPGQKAEVSVRLTAPNRGGTHDSYWKMHNYAGQEFGAGYPPSIPLWAIINVNFFQVQANLQATASAQSAGEGSLLASKPLGTSAPAGSQPADNTSTEPAQSGGAGACNASEDPAVTSQIIELVNATREQNGLAALDVSGALSEAARLHSIDMACTQNASHTGCDGSTWSDRVAAQGYPRPRSSRENIFAGDPAMGATAQGVFDWWMSSQVHHDNMLWPDVAEIGVGYAYYNGEGYYTLIVAKP